MGDADLAEQFEDQFRDVLSRLESKELFRSDWDIASFAMFFIFIGGCSGVGFPGLFWSDLPLSSKHIFETVEWGLTPDTPPAPPDRHWQARSGHVFNRVQLQSLLV